MNKAVRAEFDDWFWQRLVDGQLSPGELRRLMAACEADAELWKCCAVAFLEEQALNQSLKESMSPSFDSVNWLDDGAMHNARTMPGQQPVPASAQTRSNHLSSNATVDRSPRGGGGVAGANLFHFLSLSALVLLAFGIGWQASRRVHQSVVSGTVSRVLGPSPSLVSTSQVDAGVGVSSSTKSTQTMFVSEGSPGRARTLTPDDRLPSELNKLSNLEVGRSYGVVPVTLDGVPALVPLERVEFRAREPY